MRCLTPILESSNAGHATLAASGSDTKADAQKKTEPCRAHFFGQWPYGIPCVLCGASPMVE